MSYCRWSSMDYQCDLYVYEHCDGGFVTIVAKNRVVFAEPLPSEVPFDADHCHEWYARHQQVMDLVGRSERRPIGLPHDGESFNDPSPADCADRLERLRALGYKVPQRAIDALRGEVVAD